ncbi:hypothetical protein [Oceanospirillum sediminis]|uniref:Carboxyltransferase domain-containing protein n=1 Tax=Oceanospirillum sediminis TaxID=2760088 RepID=A0A839IQH0_9GAMM|nr:hypothetical protein [Oceanospirillum sediminis]MBB1486739.1 hypothetical protein [Oceanospirillum sediminis]
MRDLKHAFSVQAASADSLILKLCDGEFQCSETGILEDIAVWLEQNVAEITEVIQAERSLLICFDLLQTCSASLMQRLPELLKQSVTERKPVSETFVPKDKKTQCTVGQEQGFHVIHPGLMSRFQNTGITGARSNGSSSGGAADEHAYYWANHLLQNRWNAGAVEVCFGGLKLQSQVDTLIAVTGADLSLMINDQPAPGWEILPVRAGDRIEFGYPKNGTRAYLAVKGGFSVQAGSTGMVCEPSDNNAGIPLAKTLRFGDLLACSEQEHRIDKALQGLIGKRVSNSYIPDYGEPLVLRVILAEQAGHFTPDQLDLFFNQCWEIRPDSDTSATTLNGCQLKSLYPVAPLQGAEVGRIQLDDDCQPVILMQDRQRLTDRPVIGYVYPPDLGLLAQRQPKTTLSFRVISLYEAQLQLKRFYRYFK